MRRLALIIGKESMTIGLRAGYTFEAFSSTVQSVVTSVNRGLIDHFVAEHRAISMERAFLEEHHTQLRVVLQPDASPYADLQGQLPFHSETAATKLPMRNKKPTRQKEGRSQMQFMEMMQMNKNPLHRTPPGTVLTLEEVAKHNTKHDAWTVYRGKVYDITMYLDFHPGGKAKLMEAAGIDCTDLFDAYHSWVNCDQILGKLCLGTLERSGKPQRNSRTSLMVPGQRGPVHNTPTTLSGNIAEGTMTMAVEEREPRRNYYDTKPESLGARLLSPVQNMITGQVGGRFQLPPKKR